MQVGTAERVSSFWKEAPRVEERHLSGLLAIQFQREEIVWRGASVPAAGPVEGPSHHCWVTWEEDLVSLHQGIGGSASRKSWVEKEEKDDWGQGDACSFSLGTLRSTELEELVLHSLELWK